MDILNFYLRTKEERTRCNNTSTSLSVIEDIPENVDVLSYVDNKGITHCFEPGEVDYLLSTKTNHWTRAPLPKEFVDKLRLYRNSDRYKTSMEEGVVQEKDEHRRMIDEIDDLLHTRGLTRNSGGDPYISVHMFLNTNKDFWPVSYRNLTNEEIVYKLYNIRDTMVDDWYIIYIIVKYATDQAKLIDPATQQGEIDNIMAYLPSYRKILAKFFAGSRAALLRKAVESNDLASLIALKQEGATINDVRAKDNYALTHSAEHNYIGIVKYLHTDFELTADDARAGDNRALKRSAENGHIEVIKYLHTDYGLTAEDARTDHNYSLKHSAENGKIEVVKYLHTGFGLTIDDARAGDNRALRQSAWNGYIEVVKYLHIGYKLTIADARANDNHALKNSAYNGHIEVVKYLHTGYKLTAKDARATSNFALEYSAYNGHIEVVKYLHTGFGLTIDDARADHNFSLKNSTSNGKIEVVKYLHTGFGLTIDDARADHNFALRNSAYNGHIEVVKYLHTGYGLTAEDARADNNSALKNSAKNGHIEVVKYLHTGYGLTAEDAKIVLDTSTGRAKKYLRNWIREEK